MTLFPAARNVFVILSTFFCLVFDSQAAVIKLPQTGQSQCYSDNGSAVSCKGTGQDGESRAGQVWPSPRFIAEPLTVKDNLTNLTWTSIAREAGFEYSCFPVQTTTAMTWEQTFQAANCLNSKNYGGFSDWRVPNVIEMASLLNLADADGVEWLSQFGFHNASGSFWTSTTAAFNDLYAYRINYFNPGSVSAAQKTDQNGVWMVRGSTSGIAGLMKTGQTKTYHAGDDGALQLGIKWPGSRFFADGDCVFDTMTGLAWTSSMDLGKGEKPFDDAIATAKKADYCGFTDWRIPNHHELLSMINFGEPSVLGWLKSQGFKGAASENNVWSSSAYAWQTNSVWTLMMGSRGADIWADVKQKKMHFENRIWLVRTVPPAPPAVSAVVPGQGPNDYPVTFYVNGSGFSEGDVVYLGDKALATNYSSPLQLAAYVPMAVAPGAYSVTVVKANGGRASILNGFTVLPPTADDLFAYSSEFYSARQIEILGEPTTIRLLVRRFGGIDPITDLKVRFYKGSSSGQLIGTGVIPVMNPYSSAAVTVDWTPDEKGLLTLTAVIDSPPTETNPATDAVSTGVQVVKLDPTPTPVPTKPAQKATPKPTPTPEVPDHTAPVITSFQVDDGSFNSSHGQSVLVFSATDPDSPPKTASGVAWAYYTVWEYYPWANDWFATYDSGWFPVTGSSSTAYYFHGYFSGPRYIELWVADRAQNVSSYAAALTNYIKPDDFVFEGESKFYLYPLRFQQTISASSYWRWGDADLYIWPPDWKTRGPWFSLYANPDALTLAVPVEGYYWVEIFGYQSAAYDLAVQLGASPMMSAAAATMPLSERAPKGSPGVSMTLPEGSRRLEPNAAAFKVQLASPRDGGSVKGTRVTLKWKALYLSKGYVIQTSSNGRKWKNATRSKSTKVRLEKLKAGKLYYWRVKGTNPLSPTGVWSDAWSFRMRK